MARSLFLIAFLLLFFGCDSTSGDPDDDGTLALGNVTARIDGERFESSFAIATLNSQIQDLTVSAGSSTGWGLAVSLLEFENEGSYTLTTTLPLTGLAVVTEPNDTQGYTSTQGGSGTVVVTELTDEHVQGAFSFTATNGSGKTIEVTEGRFNVRVNEVAGTASVAVF